MADDLKRVGLSFKADGTADFTRSLKEVNSAVSENYAQFKLAQSQWDKNTSALTKLGDKQKYLQGQTQLYTDKVKILEEQLKDMSDSEGKNAEKIEKKKQKLQETQTTLENYRNKVTKLQDELSKMESEENKNEAAIEKKRSELEKAQKAVTDYGSKSDKLAKQIENLEKSEGNNEAAIAKKKTEITKTQAKLNEYEKELKDVNEELKKGTANLEEYAKKLEKTSEKVTSAGKTLTKTVTAPIAGIGVAAVKTAADFESAMSQVQATMGITKDATSEVNGETVNTMDSLNELAQLMGRETAFSAKECAEALNYLALAGYDTQQMTDTLPTVLNLAAAGGMNLADASNMLTHSMNALGMGAGEAEAMVDQMSKTASSTGTTVSELGDAILSIGATAKSIRGGTAELNTALGLLANAGITASDGGTHLRNIILSLQSPTDTAAEKMKKLGVEVYDSEGNMKSLNEILGSLNESMDGMTSEEKDNIISKIFNKTDLAAVNALLGSTGSEWDSLQQSIIESTGAAQQQADTQLDNLEGQITILKSALEGLAISIGQILMPYVKSLVEHIQNAVEKFNGLDEGTKKTIVTIAAIAAVIGPVLIIFGTLAGSVSKIITLTTQVVGLCVKIPGIMSTIGGSAKMLWGILMMNPLAKWLTIITAVIAALVLLYNKCEWFRDAVDTVFGTVGKWIGSLVEKFQTVLGFLGKIGGKIGSAYTESSFATASANGVKLPVKWNAKGGIFNKPTLIGTYGNAYQGVGEAGKEAVLPIDLLKSYIREENQANNEVLASMLAEAIQSLSLVAENNIYIGDKKTLTALTELVLKKMSDKMLTAQTARGM